jgi:hypothetical protein
MIDDIKLNVPEKEKTEKWVENISIALRNKVAGDPGNIEKDILCWKMYHNTWEDHKYDYLRKYGDNYLPSQVRRIPLQKHFIKLLVSQEARRPFNFSVSAIDEDSMNEKIVEKAKQSLNKILVKLKTTSKQRADELMQMDQQLAQFKSELEQFKPQTQEDVQKYQDAVAQLAQFEVIAFQNREFVKLQDVLDNQDIQEIEQMMAYSSQDINEEQAQLLLIHLNDRLRIRDKKRVVFEDRCVTGKGYFYVDARPGEKHPVYENLTSMMVAYPAIDSVKFVQNGPWVAIKDVVSLDSIIASYGTELEEKYGKIVFDNLEKNPLYESNSTFLATPEGALLASQTTYKGIQEGGRAIERVRVFFKSQRKVAIKVSPNSYSNIPFQHTLSPYKEYIDKADYTFKNGFYVNKMDKNLVYKEDEVITFSKKKGEKIKYLYTNDIYEAVVIGGEFVVCAGKKKSIIRDPYRHSEVVLPVFGPTYAGANEAPSSIVWDTKDIDELYKITLYHMELAMALAGTKTTLVDRSQRPATMSDEEWEYQRKIGNLFIETIDANGRQKNNSFNQWQMFDNSISASIAYYQPVLEMLYNIMGTIIGIPRPREGQVVSTDQVGTSQIAMQQSSLMTEILYEEHDEIVKQSQEYLVNLALKYNYKDGYMFEIKNPEDGRRRSVVIPGGKLSKRHFSILVESSAKDERNLEELKQIAAMQFSKAMLPFKQLVGLYAVESVKQLEKKLDYFNDQAQELAAIQQQSGMNAQLEFEQKKKKFEQDHQLVMEQMKLEVDKMKLQLDQAKMQMDNALKTRDLDIKEQQMVTNANLKMMELDLEDKTETAMLIENRDSRVTQNNLDVLNMKINAATEDKKIKQAERAKKNSPEHLNDN